MNIKRTFKTIGKILLWVVGIWACLLIILQISLSSSFLTKTANKMAAEYVDADVAIGKISFSVFRHFPNVSLKVEDVTVTYPSDRYTGLQDGALLLRAGTGDRADTLCSLGGFSAAVNVAALLAGQIRVPYIGIESPRVFAKKFGSDLANWDIMKEAETGDEDKETEKSEFLANDDESEAGSETADEPGDSTDDDQTSSSFPFKIVVDKVSLTDRMALVYCSVPDSTYATVMLKEMTLRMGNQKFGNKSSKKGSKQGETLASSLPDSLRAVIDSIGSPEGTPVPSLLEGSSALESIPGEPESPTTLQKAGDIMSRMRENPGETVQDARKAMKEIGGGARLAFNVDSLTVGGRIGGDTLSFRLGMLRLGGKGNRIGLQASANVGVALRSLGRISIPIELRSRFSFMRGGKPGIKINGFRANIADIPLYLDAELRFPGDSIQVKGKFGVDECALTDVLAYLGNSSFAPLLSRVTTDARISLDARAKGYYSTSGVLPSVSATIRIPESLLRMDPIDSDNTLALDVTASVASSGRADVTLTSLSVSGLGISIGANGSASDLLGKDPLIALDASLGVSLDTLRPVIREELGYIFAGSLNAALKGQLKQSQMNLAHIGEADLSGSINTDRLVFISPADSMGLRLDSLNVSLYAFENEHARNPGQDDRLLAVDVSLDSVNVNYKRTIELHASDLGLRVMSDAGVMSSVDSTAVSTDSNAFFPFGGSLTAGSLTLKDQNGQVVGLRGTKNRFSLFPKRENPSVPLLRLNSDTDLLFMKDSDTRVGVHSLGMEATAAMNSIERKQKARAFMDSLSRANPGVPKDSLRTMLMAGRSHRMPEGLSNDDFKSSDLDLRLDAAMAKYFMDWDIDGSISLERMGVGTPVFPLRTSLEGVSANFNNNQVSLDGFHLASGSSSMDLWVQVSNLRPVLMGRGRLRIDAGISSESLNANELIAAYLKGTEYKKASTYLDTTSMDAYDEELEASYVLEDLADTSVTMGLIVIPANLVANLSLDARNISYSTLSIDTLSAAVKVQDRVAQISEAKAVSNVGNIAFEGFYATKSKEDISAGFDLNLEDITAEDVVALIPAVDSLMPMITSFKGKLGCTLSATTEIDTLMNLKPATLNGVLRIKGQNLTMEDNEAVQKMVKLLMFKNKDDWQIDSMTVEGIVSDSQLEIFPFVMKVDRYTLALSGLQNLDSSFKYHISVIKSPLPFRLGLNIKGNFDKYKFGIGKAKYKSADVPVFSTVIDETRLNLTESIKNVFQKGVDNIIRENEAQEAIRKRKEEIGYEAAYEEDLEEVSDEEQAQLDSYSEEEE